MTIKRRIERLEEVIPPESSPTFQWLMQFAEPYKNDEERKEVETILRQLDDGEISDIPMNLYPKVFFGMMFEADQ